jgi:hypothetical protein
VYTHLTNPILAIYYKKNATGLGLI